MVLLEEPHHSVGEERHVFADKEGQMASSDLLIVHHLLSNCVSDPSGILSICNHIVCAREKSYWNSADFGNWNFICDPLLLAVEPVCVVRGKYLEPVLVDVLGVVEKLLDASSIWLVTHVHCKPVLIIEEWMAVLKWSAKELT